MAILTRLMLVISGTAVLGGIVTTLYSFFPGADLPSAVWITGFAGTAIVGPTAYGCLVFSGIPKRFGFGFGKIAAKDSLHQLERIRIYLSIYLVTLTLVTILVFTLFVPEGSSSPWVSSAFVRVFGAVIMWVYFFAFEQFWYVDRFLNGRKV